MTEAAKATTPPYTTYKSFVNLINDLRETGVPSHITRSVVKGSNSGKAMMSSSLKALGLIHDDSRPTDRFKELVSATKDEYPKVLASVVRAAYPFLFDGSIDLANTTTEKVSDKFKDAGASGSTISKGVAFFLAAAKEAGISISSRVKAPTPVRNGSGSRAKGKKAMGQGEGDEADDQEQADDDTSDSIPPGMIKIPIPLHGVGDGAIYLPEGMNKKQWAYAKKMAQFILDNYHQDFDDNEIAL